MNKIVTATAASILILVLATWAFLELSKDSTGQPSREGTPAGAELAEFQAVEDPAVILSRPGESPPSIVEETPAEDRTDSPEVPGELDELAAELRSELESRRFFALQKLGLRLDREGGRRCSSPAAGDSLAG